MMIEKCVLGLNTALISPYTQNGIDVESFEKLLERQIENGVDGITLFGTTGEGVLLTKSEKDTMMKSAVKMCKNKCKIVVNVGEISAEKTVENCHAAEENGADALLVITPYYLTTTQTGLIEYYSFVASCANLPIIAYNVPSRTGVNMEVETAVQLYKKGVICGIKQANGKILDCIELVYEGIPTMCGDDSLAPIFFQNGAVGIISVISNIYPKIIRGFVDFKGDFDCENYRKKYRDLLEMCDLFFKIKNPMATKYFAYKTGLISQNFLRLPLTKTPVEICEKIDLALCKFEKYL